MLGETPRNSMVVEDRKRKDKGQPEIYPGCDGPRD